jgi:hypothetical protein
VVLNVRRTSILAYPCTLLLRLIRPDHETTDTVSLDFIHIACLTQPHRHMIKYRYIPFDIGRKTRYGGKK